MRDIKLRAWHRERQRMTPIMTLAFLNHEFIMKLESPVDEYDWLEYAGLKDKHGKEIWEGDKIKSNKGIIFTVVFSPVSARWVGRAINKWSTTIGKYIYQSLPYFVKRGEVIGNVYENP